jgi:cytoskeletal protein RodZ
MEESVGKKLSKARLKRGLSIDEAAHATKLRPDKIVALESDDYSMFASNVYARGFLQIYGRFLDVDVAEFAGTLAGNSAISVEDYQYLNSNAPVRVEESASVAFRPEKRGPGVLTILGFLVLLGAVGFGFQFYVNWQRIAAEPATHKEAATSTPAPTGAAAMDTGPAHVAAAKPAAQAPAMRAQVKAPSVSDRDFVAPAPPPTTAPTSNEVLVQPLRKTWVVVRKDDPNSPPIFEDYLYPDTPALKLKGTRFFIEARDPTAIQIRKNGAPMAYQAPGVPVP